ncbi:flagellar basal body protein [Acetobacteraceae bacterium KSS8]|uniref:Flagellar basal body protein n=1 Tax=Endosaccharibacter trunci TaxID=2812733 RepID=A0ABT1W9F0_9PROT|nr:flagellar basal body protein [Acetobacteraceae bacterium KSS8]
MDAGGTDLLGLAASRLNWLDQRQKVLARNIANSDTPNFMPRDEQSFDDVMRNGTLALTQTNSRDLAGDTSNAGTVAMKVKSRSINGNGVALDEQMMKVADTDTQQRLVTSLYSRYMGMFQTAIGKN